MPWLSRYILSLGSPRGSLRDAGEHVGQVMAHGEMYEHGDLLMEDGAASPRAEQVRASVRHRATHACFDGARRVGREAGTAMLRE